MLPHAPPFPTLHIYTHRQGQLLKVFSCTPKHTAPQHQKRHDVTKHSHPPYTIQKTHKHRHSQAQALTNFKTLISTGTSTARATPLGHL